MTQDSVEKQVVKLFYAAGIDERVTCLIFMKIKYWIVGPKNLKFLGSQNIIIQCFYCVTDAGLR